MGLLYIFILAAEKTCIFFYLQIVKYYETIYSIKIHFFKKKGLKNFLYQL